MPDTIHQDLPTTPLDPHLLSTPFQVQTNWHVITGAPSSGKTTIIDMLAGLGFQTVSETSRPYIEREVAKGRTFADIYKSWADQQAMNELQLRTERNLRPSDLNILDNAIPDNLAFNRLKSMDLNQLLVECFHHRYASVFILDRLPLQLDGMRADDDPAADYLDRWHESDYTALGYNIIRVPVLPPQQRLSFILEALTKRVANFKKSWQL